MRSEACALSLLPRRSAVTASRTCHACGGPPPRVPARCRNPPQAIAGSARFTNTANEDFRPYNLPYLQCNYRKLSWYARRMRTA
eukprot:652478-Prorocentrum_minimum.AAC.1